jgi:hypothetical protein
MPRLTFTARCRLTRGLCGLPFLREPRPAATAREQVDQARAQPKSLRETDEPVLRAIAP